MKFNLQSLKFFLWNVIDVPEFFTHAKSWHYFNITTVIEWGRNVKNMYLTPKYSPDVSPVEEERGQRGGGVIFIHLTIKYHPEIETSHRELPHCENFAAYRKVTLSELFLLERRKWKHQAHWTVNCPTALCLVAIIYY